jgi:alginate O-acetyltransferase complex protein AlgI
LAASINIVVALPLIWVVPRLLIASHPLLAGWCGMIGLVLLLHFGLLNLLSTAWRNVAGVNAPPLMNRPLAARSLADFWSRRWNTAFSAIANEVVFKPMARINSTLAFAAVFLVSGLIHELVISLPARSGFGKPTLYFMTQLGAIAIERMKVSRHKMPGFGLRAARHRSGRLYVLVVTIVPLPLLFHDAFVANVMLPFLDSIGSFARGGFMLPHKLPLLLFVAGLLHLSITSAGILMTFVLDWRKNLAPLCALTREIVWTHALFVLMTIVAFGLVSLALPTTLASGSPLARAVCGFIALFWGIRLIIQFVLFDARPHMTKPLLKLGYHGLTLCFAYFTLTYALAAVMP